MKKFGYVDPLVWNERTGHLVGGHQRFKIIMEDRPTEIQVSVVSLNDQDEKALNVALNKISGHWDETKLEKLLTELKDNNLDLETIGFSEEEYEELLDSVSIENEIVVVEEDNDTDAEEELEEIQGVEENSDEGTLSEEELKSIKITTQSWDRGGFNGGRIGGGGGGGSIVPKPKPSKPSSKPSLPVKGFKNGAAGEKHLNAVVGGSGHKTFKDVKVYDHKKRLGKKKKESLMLM